jgi:hypothetical protein
MAELLKQQHNLVVLQLSLDRSTPHSAGETVITLQSASKTLIEIKVSCKELGLPIHLREARRYRHSNHRYTIPDIVVQDLQQKLSDILDPGIPLWLQLKEDCGNLALVPWERLLQPKLEIPILRLPYFDLKPFSATESCLDIVLCASSPKSKEPLPVESWLVTFIHSLLEAKLREQVTIHVFTDAHIFHSLQNTLGNQPATADGGKVQLYNPEEAPIDKITQPLEGSTGDLPSLENPWLLWIVDTLRGRSVDAVHFLCHGYLATDQGALAIQSSPVPNSNEEQTLFVGPQQLTNFALDLGAWSIGFSSPPNNYSGSGTRLLADQLARLRTGPVLLHEIMEDPSSLTLVRTYRFLCNEEQDALPSSPAIALYCHPSRIQQTTNPTDEIDQESLMTRYTLAKGKTLKHIQSKNNTPAWIASSQRYLEQSVADLLNAEADPSTPSAAQEGTKEALSFLSELLERHAKE